MCGISCVVALDTFKALKVNPLEHRKTLETSLDASLHTIRHRGPDARGQWISEENGVGLGYVRLAINDLKPTGDQPFHDKQGWIHAVVNGEIYNHQQLRTELIIEPYDFKGGSDCEIVVALYLNYGINFLSKLRGEFALCLYDSRRQIFIAARDRYGIKPLFWTVVENRLLVASEAKAFLPLGWRPEWDVRSIVEDGWLHDGRTLFRGVNKIQPGHYLTCYSFGYTTQRQYWEVEFRDKRVLETRTETEMIFGLRQQMLDAVRIRLRADVPIGIYLSGGIDSAVVAGMTSHLIKTEGIPVGNNALSTEQQITCLGIGFEEGSGFDEGPIAQRTADALGFPFIMKRMDEAALAERFEDATYHSEHHNPDLNSVAKFALSDLARESGCKVILSGEGSDEHFGGYWHFLPDYLRESDPAWTPAESLQQARRRQELLAKAENDAEPGYKGTDKSFISRGSPVASRMLNNTSISSFLWTVTMAHFAPWTKSYGNLDVQQTRAENPDGRILGLINTKWHPLHTSQYIWTKSILPNLILTCMGDRMEMAHSIEGRPPFLDHVLTEYVNGLPPSLKIKYDPSSGGLTEKWVLREASRPFVTEEIYRRKKHAFTAPIIYPTNGALHQMVLRLVTRVNVEQLGFVNWDKVDGLVELAFGPAKDISAMRLFKDKAAAQSVP